LLPVVHQYTLLCYHNVMEHVKLVATPINDIIEKCCLMVLTSSNLIF